MKKKSYYLFGTIISLIASLFSSTTASACGGDMGYVEPKSEKSYKDDKSYYDEKSSPNITYGTKNSIIVTSSPGKAYKGSKVFVDGMEAPIAAPKGNQSEKQRILSVMKEYGCSIAKNPDLIFSEEKIKKIFKKYGFKTDEASFKALEAKYENDEEFKNKVEETAKQAAINCGASSTIF